MSIDWNYPYEAKLSSQATGLGVDITDDGRTISTPGPTEFFRESLGYGRHVYSANVYDFGPAGEWIESHAVTSSRQFLLGTTPAWLEDVAISGDGKNLLFAEGLGSFRVPPGDLTISVGIYQRDAANGTWSLGSGFETLARAGWSGKEFFLATDAKTILAYSTVFAKDNAGEWQEVADLSGSVPAINSASTLAANGTTAAIATKASGADYSVRVFDRDSGGTWRESAVLTAGDGVNGDSFGHDMAFSAAGDIALVGAPDDDDNGTDSGSAYVFVKNAAGAWQQSAKLVANDGSAGDDFGAAVSLSEDGRFALVGAPRDDDKGTDSGSAYVFGINPAGQWQQLRKVAASDGSAGDVFGSYLDLSAAGAVAVIGAPEGGEKGAVYVFTAATSGPTTIFPGTPGDDNYCGANGGDQAAGAVNDSMTGLAGNDCFSPKGGLDTVFGGPGTDFLDYSAASAVFGAPPAGAVINLASGVSSDPWGNPDYTLELENAQGTELGDWLVGTEGDNALTGLGGADTAVGFGGADTIDLGEGADQAYGYAGNDSIKGGAGDDLFYGMEGADSLAGDGDNDLLVGGIDNDTLTGGLGNDSLFGETGDDSIDAGVGSDVADGGPGNDRIELGGYLSFPFWWSIDGNDSGFGGDGDDTIAGGGGDLLMGQGGNDVLLGDVSAAPTFTLRTLIGGDGNDVLFNGRNFANPGDVATGPANLFADAGDDTVIGGHSSDVADGGAGNDSLHAGGGADIVNGGRGVDQMAGGAGSDTFVISSVLSGTSAAAPDVITDFQGAGTSLAGDQDYLLLQTQSGNLATASFTHLGAGLWQFSDGAFSTFVQILAGGGVPVTALLGPGYADTADFGIF